MRPRIVDCRYYIVASLHPFNESSCCLCSPRLLRNRNVTNHHHYSKDFITSTYSLELHQDLRCAESGAIIPPTVAKGRSMNTHVPSTAEQQQRQTTFVWRASQVRPSGLYAATSPQRLCCQGTVATSVNNKIVNYREWRTIRYGRSVCGAESSRIGITQSGGERGRETTMTMTFWVRDIHTESRDRSLH